MTMAVIDTNVLLVANGMHAGVSEDCQILCVRLLAAQMQSGVTVIDDNHLILHEYLRRTRPGLAKGPGDVFLKWLLSNQANSARVQCVPITELAADEFAEFPDAALQRSFDPADRKFAAVANAHPAKPPVWQAADCKWLAWWPALKAKGVIVEFLCPADVCRFYSKKFPDQPVPALPET